MDHRSKSRSSRKKQISESEPEGTRIPKNYMKVLNPIIWEKRVQFNLNIPWSLTPKGYTKLQRKLTSPNILHPMRRSGSAAFHVYKKLFTDRNSEIISGNDTSYSENGNIYPSPTRMRSFKGTEYETIMCRMLETKELYEDPCFPANDDSIGNIPDLLGKVEWKRPKDINHDAQFYTNTLSRFDVDQGALGDCWFNAALATITKYPTLLNQVIPLNQVLKGSGYRV
ncbi:unnamed protein product [Heterobilharzia americana]|nr:unnamed protein product [Heterobilharzia americana]